MKTLVAIKTCHAKRAWAEAQRQTWVKDVVSSDIDVRFFLGCPPSQPVAYAGDEVLLNCPDDYAGLTLKAKLMCSWAYYYNYDEVVMCDDDVYAVPARLRYLASCGLSGLGCCARKRGFLPQLVSKNP